MDNIERLSKFGLTRQEAAIYEVLLTHGTMNGYELGKRTGISRSNVYTALDRLVEKGAAYLIEGDSSQYIPVDLGEFCENNIRKLENIKNLLIENMPEKKDAPEGYITIKGKEQIKNKMKTMILNAEKRVYISAPKNIITEIDLELKEVIKKGVKMVIIAGTAIQFPGAVIYLMEKPQSSIRLIVDSKTVLTGDIEDDESTCLYSNKRNLVELMKDSLRNEIDIAELKRGKLKK